MPPLRGSTASDQADPAPQEANLARTAPPGLPPCRAPGTSASLPWSSHPTRAKGQTAAGHGGASGRADECRRGRQPRGGSEPRGHSLRGAR